MIDSSKCSPDSADQFKVKLRQHLQQYLDQQGITATQLAKRSGVSKQVISTWLGGASPRRLDQVKKVADAIGVTVDELCFGSEAPEPNAQTFIGNEWMSGVFELKVRRLK